METIKNIAAVLLAIAILYFAFLILPSWGVPTDFIVLIYAIGVILAVRDHHPPHGDFRYW